MVDTFLVGTDNEEVHCHRAYCQIKVFKVRSLRSTEVSELLNVWWGVLSVEC